MTSRARPRRLRLLFSLIFFSCLGFAQVPKIGTIDFYGIRKVPETRVRKALGVTEGSPLPSSKGAIEERIEALPHVTGARLEALCCDHTSKAILYVGIEEKGGDHFDVHPEPTGQESLPEEIGSAYAAFLQAVGVAARKGDTAEDLTRGHSLMA